MKLPRDVHALPVGKDDGRVTLGNKPILCYTAVRRCCGFARDARLLEKPGVRET